MTVDRPTPTTRPYGYWRRHAPAVMRTATTGQAYALTCGSQQERKSIVASIWPAVELHGLRLRSRYRPGDPHAVLWCEPRQGRP